MRKHSAFLDGKHFKEELPSENINETLLRLEGKIHEKVMKYDEKIGKMREK